MNLGNIIVVLTRLCICVVIMVVNHEDVIIMDTPTAPRKTVHHCVLPLHRHRSLLHKTIFAL